MMKRLMFFVGVVFFVCIFGKVGIFAQECSGGGVYNEEWGDGHIIDITKESTTSVPIGSWGCFVEVEKNVNECRYGKCWNVIAKKCISDGNGGAVFGDENGSTGNDPLESMAGYWKCGQADTYACSSDAGCTQRETTGNNGGSCTDNDYGGITRSSGSLFCLLKKTGQSYVRKCENGKISITKTCSESEICVNYDETKTADCVADDPDNFCTKANGVSLEESGFGFSKILKGNSRCLNNKLYSCEEDGIPELQVEDCSKRKDKNIFCGLGDDNKYGCINEEQFKKNDQSSLITSTSRIYNPICNGNGISTAFGCIPYDASGMVAKLLQILFGVAGGIAFLLMVYGFILVATSSGDEKKLQGAKETITSAITGLLISIFALFLFRLIVINILQIPLN